MAPYINQEDKKTLTNIMNETKHWFESENPDIIVKSHIDEKDRALTGFGDRIYKRKNDWENLNATIPNFQYALNQNITKISEEYNKLKNNQASNLTMENVEELNKIVENYNTTLNNSIELAGKALKFVDPPVSYEALNRHLKEFNEVLH